jgi:hypothetical protein
MEAKTGMKKFRALCLAAAKEAVPCKPRVPGSCPAKEYLDRFSKRMPEGMWKEADLIRESYLADALKHKTETWPGGVLLPSSFWLYSLIFSAYPELRGCPDALNDSRVLDIGARLWLHARISQVVGSWRVSQQIYRFDPDVFEAVSKSTVSGDLPCSLFFALPAWGVYVETPGFDDYMPANKEGKRVALRGFFAALDHFKDDDIDETVLTLVLDADHGGEDLFVSPVSIPLLEGKTLPECLAAAGKEGRKDYLHEGGLWDLPLDPLVSLLLYLCSEKPDVALAGERASVGKPEPKKTKKGNRFFPPPKTTTWDVGARIGAALRASSGWTKGEPGDPTGRRVRGHVRGGHWHTYLTGAGRTSRILKWLPPTLVNAADAASLPAVVRKVS